MQSSTKPNQYMEVLPAYRACALSMHDNKRVTRYEKTNHF